MTGTQNKHKVHLICNAHLDPVWQWRWTEGCSEAIATFKNAVQLLQEHPGLIFNHNEAVLYQWVLKYDNKLFRQIQDLSAQGRWHISGGWFLQPDLNLPPTRNLIKHIREGKKFFKKYFNTEPRVAYNFDSFGHSAGLPHLLREYGYEFYIHMRPEKDFLHLPDNLYVWKGSDGTSIPAYRIEIGLYHTERTNIRQRLDEGAELAIRLNRDVAVFWGLGNHGGGATRKDLASIDEHIRQEKRVEIIHSTPEKFFESLSQYIADIPVYDGELQRVFTGTYTSMARLKRKALQASGAAHQMEQLLKLSPAGWENSINEHASTIDQIWQDILFNDFHDILTGSCTQSAEDDAMELYGRAMENIREVNMDLITQINHSAQALEAHIPVTVFHALEGLTSFPVEFECMSDYRPFSDEEKELVLTDRQGNVIPSQEEQPEALLPFNRWRRKIVFMADKLPKGVHHFALNPLNAEHMQERTTYSVTDPYHIKFRVVNDEADSWGTDTWKWDDVIGEFGRITGSEKIISQGPIRTIQESALLFHNSKIVSQLITYSNWPVTEYRIRINWHEEHCRLKLVIPLDLTFDTCTCEIPGGSITRQADGQEHSHGSWMTIGNRLNVVHSGLHGYDFVPGEMRLSVLRSVAYCHWHEYDLADTNPKFMDAGYHEVRLVIWRSGKGNPGVEEISGWLNTPPLVFPHLPVS